MQVLILLLRIAVILVEYWRDPNRLARELEKETETAYEASLNDFRKRVAARHTDAVAASMADRLRELRRMRERTDGSD